MRRKNLTGSIMLLLTAVIWGCAFVAQSEAMNYMEPFTFQGIRSILGGIVLLPLIAVMDGAKKRRGTYRKMTGSERKRLCLTGALCGVILCAASLLQQFGINGGTSSGKAGFLTALYILLVPVFGLLFFRRRVRKLLWLCILMALGGLWLLCMKDTFSFQTSDLIVLACSVIFALHIIVVDRFAPGLDGVRLSCIQFFVAGVLSCVGMLLFEHPELQQLRAGWLSIAYSGVMSCGVAYTLQILGQQRTEPTVASMLMSFESVFAVLGGIVLLHQLPTAKEWAGCALMFAAIMLAQLPEKQKKTAAEKNAAEKEKNKVLQEHCE